MAKCGAFSRIDPFRNASESVQCAKVCAFRCYLAQALVPLVFSSIALRIAALFAAVR